MKTKIKLSNPGKMPCKTWSLQAIDTCPGSRDRSHPSGLVPACRGCYATQGNYRFPNVKAPRLFNQADWTRKDWEADMVSAIGSDKYFRWFDSGDMYSVPLARKIYRIMVATPETKHWLPTRMYKFAKFLPILQRMAALPNVVVRASSDGIHGEIVATDLPNSSTIFDAESQDTPKGAVMCGAYQNAGKCGDCRACWNKSVPVIAYPQHGKAIAKVNRDLIAVAA